METPRVIVLRFKMGMEVCLSKYSVLKFPVLVQRASHPKVGCEEVTLRFVLKQT